MQATSDSLNLSTQQRKQTDDWVSRFDQTVYNHIRGTFVWAMYPEQFDPKKPFELIADKAPESDGKSLAERVGTKPSREDQLVTQLRPQILGATPHEELAALWSDAGEIGVGELWGYFTRYIYLPRLVRREVLDSAIEQAVMQALVQGERFAIAAGKDKDLDTGRYRRLIVPPAPSASVQVIDSTLLIDVDKAQAQVDADQAAAATVADEHSESSEGGTGAAGLRWSNDGKASVDATVDSAEPESPLEAILSRYFGSVKIDPDRYARDIGNVTREVIDRLAGRGATLEITIDIQATKPEGFDEFEARTIRENTRVLKFDPTSDFDKN